MNLENNTRKFVMECLDYIMQTTQRNSNMK